MLEIERFVLGPVQTNAYLIADTSTREAAVIDPAWEGETILKSAHRKGWVIEHIWLTHAHFDHVAGVKGILDGLNPPPSVALHPYDLPLWQLQGGAPFFGMHVELGAPPQVELFHGQKLQLGNVSFEVRHTPGHTPGHVVFYCAEARVLFCGDVIFWGSIGRTDLPGGNFETLMHSIRTQVLTLPAETRLLSGHGPETTIAQELQENPFLN